jgi:hypothetical protein
MDQAAVRGQVWHRVHYGAHLVDVAVDQEDGGKTEEGEGLRCRTGRGTASDYKARKTAWRIHRGSIRRNGQRRVRMLLFQRTEKGVPDTED